MIIIGADYHPAFQQIAFVDTETGELQERRLEHPEEAEKFYRELAARGKKVRVGMEASGHAHWFERLLAILRQSSKPDIHVLRFSPESTKPFGVISEKCANPS